MLKNINIKKAIFILIVIYLIFSDFAKLKKKFNFYFNLIKIKQKK